jgi:hypothetical protein
MTALTTIFMHVVCHPADASTSNDIALMEVVVGFFGRVEFMTSGEAAFTKTSEFVRQARWVVAQSLHDAVPSNPSVLGDTGIGRPLLSLELPDNDIDDESRGQPGNTMNPDGDNGSRSMAGPEKDAEAPAHTNELHRARTNDSYLGIYPAQQPSTSCLPSDADLAGLELPFGDLLNDHWLDVWTSSSGAADVTFNRAIQNCM